MDKLVLIRRKTAERNDVELTAETWQEFTKLFCEVVTQPAGEQLQSGQPTGETVYVLTSHWTPQAAAIDSKMRATLPDGTLCGIRSATNTNLENKELVIVAVAKN